jgi:hypothetical protein
MAGCVLIEAAVIVGAGEALGSAVTTKALIRRSDPEQHATSAKRSRVAVVRK